MVEHGLGHLPFMEKCVVTATGHPYIGVDFAKKLCGVSIIRSGRVDGERAARLLQGHQDRQDPGAPVRACFVTGFNCATTAYGDSFFCSARMHDAAVDSACRHPSSCRLLLHATCLHDRLPAAPATILFTVLQFEFPKPISHTQS